MERSGQLVKVEDITWTSQNVNDVSIELSTDNGITWNTIESSIPNTGTYNWTVAALDSSDECLIRIKDILNTSIDDVSDGVFTIDNVSVTSFQLTVINTRWLEYGINTWVTSNRSECKYLVGITEIPVRMYSDMLVDISQ